MGKIRQNSNRNKSKFFRNRNDIILNHLFKSSGTVIGKNKPFD